MYKKAMLLTGSILFFICSWAHGFSGSGLLHPLTGIDHIIAMVAVGAWSAQLGGTALYSVPGSFLVMMLMGGAAGMQGADMASLSLLINLSILLLGVAIFLDKPISIFIAATAVGLFGFSHGYAHGRELPATANRGVYLLGFLVTTLGLHLIGALGGLLVLEQNEGRTFLQRAGGFVFLVGIFLLLRL